MGWLGKVVGGTLGFALGGPIGAVAGAALGHAFDKKEDLYLEDSGHYQHQQPLSQIEETQMTFFVAAFSMLAKIAKADGRVSEKEIEMIDQFINQELKLDQSSMGEAINIFRHQPQIISLMMDILIRVSAADGSISPEEDHMLHTAATIFNYSDSAFTRLKSSYVKEVNRYYGILNVDETASNDEIKKQYRKLVSEYHPDKIEAKGLPEEFIKFATDKFKEIQEAYDTIRKERGF